MLTSWPPSKEKYRQWPKTNCTEGEGLRDTGVNTTIVTAKLVSPEKIIPDLIHQVINADNETKFHPMAMVNFEWGGITGLEKVVVSPAIPVECLLGNDLETSDWAGVERKAPAEMLGFPEWVCVTTTSQTTCKGSQGSME